MSPPTILCLESATAVASVGLVEGDAVLAERAMAEKREHAERICGVIEEVLTAAERRLADVSAIGVGLGPGSFIGVRIAVATAKGLAIGADLPLLGISSTAILAHSCQRTGRVAVAIDAKKGQVYAAVYDIEHPLQPGREVIAPRAIDPGPAAELFRDLGPLALLVGDGAARYPDAFSLLDVTPAAAARPAAAAIYTLAAARLARGEIDDPAALAPIYARRSEAEIKRAAREVRTGEQIY